MLIRITRHGQPAIKGLKPGVNHEFPPEDCALTALGRLQAEYLGSYLKSRGGCGKIISSPYARTAETASVIAGICGTQFYLDGQIQEGRFYPEPPCPGMTLEEIRSSFPHVADDAELVWPWMQPGGVEPQEHVQERVDNFMEKLLADNPEGDFLFVGHGASVNALKQNMFRRCQYPVEDRYNWNCSLSEFELLPDGRWRANFVARFDFIPEESVSSNMIMYTSRPPELR